LRAVEPDVTLGSAVRIVKRMRMEKDQTNCG